MQLNPRYIWAALGVLLIGTLLVVAIQVWAVAYHGVPISVLLDTASTIGQSLMALAASLTLALTHQLGVSNGKPATGQPFDPATPTGEPTP